MKTIDLYNTNIKIFVDDIDYQRFLSYNWSPHYNTKKVYARAWINGTRKFMHQLILTDVPEGFTIDHIDGNGLNNCRDNLRLASRKQQSANRKKQDSRNRNASSYKGVTYRKETDKWRARIRVDGELKFLGDFYSEEAAAKAYNVAAVKYFGEFAYLNVLTKRTKINNTGEHQECHGSETEG